MQDGNVLVQHLRNERSDHFAALVKPPRVGVDNFNFHIACLQTNDLDGMNRQAE
ncbi:hypothetical protein D1872_353390 [compost metagenome]